MIFSLLINHFILLRWIATNVCCMCVCCSCSLGIPLPAVWCGAVFDHRCGHTKAPWTISHGLSAVQIPIRGSGSCWKICGLLVNWILATYVSADNLHCKFHHKQSVGLLKKLTSSSWISVQRLVDWLERLITRLTVHIGFLWSEWPSVSRKELKRSMRVLKCNHNCLHPDLRW